MIRIKNQGSMYIKLFHFTLFGQKFYIILRLFSFVIKCIIANKQTNVKVARYFLIIFSKLISANESHT